MRMTLGERFQIYDVQITRKFICRLNIYYAPLGKTLSRVLTITLIHQDTIFLKICPLLQREERWANKLWFLFFFHLYWFIQIFLTFQLLELLK